MVSRHLYFKKADPATILLNGGAFLTVPSGASQDISLIDQDGVDIVPDSVVGDVITVSVPDENGWVRPNDWLAIPSISTGEQVVYILMAVFDQDNNFAAVQFNGKYQVEWGDGVTDLVASGVTAEHNYTWASVGNVTSEGFRQALIKVTPQTGQNITGVNLQVKHSSIANGKQSNYVDMVLNIPNVAGSALTIGDGAVVLHQLCERVWIKEIGVLTTVVNLCRGLYNLATLPLFDTSSVVTFYGMFRQCYALRNFPNFNTSSATGVNGLQHMFYNSASINLYTSIDCGASTDLTASFIRNYTNRIVELTNTSLVTGITNIVAENYSLISFSMDDASAVTVTTSAFASCPNLQEVSLPNITVGFSVANAKMSAAAIDAMFTGLGTASGAQTITVTGNIGAATCNTAIATGKGFTVVI